MVPVRSTLCGSLLNIDVPIVLAPFGPWDQVDLAVEDLYEAGQLRQRSARRCGRCLSCRRRWQRLRQRTARPFAMNHAGTTVDPGRLRSNAPVRAAAIMRSTWVCRPTSSPPPTSGASSGCRPSVTSTPQSRRSDVRCRCPRGTRETRGRQQRLGGDDGAGSTGWSMSPGTSRWSPAAGSARRARSMARPRRSARRPGCRSRRSFPGVIGDAHRPGRGRSGSWPTRSALEAVERFSMLSRVMPPPFTLPQAAGIPFAPRALRTELIDRLESDPASVDPAEASDRGLLASAGGWRPRSMPLARPVDPADPRHRAGHGPQLYRLIHEATDALQRASEITGAPTPR